MLRKSGLCLAIVVVGFGLWSALSFTAQTADETGKQAAKPGKAPYVHTVIFSLKKDAPDKAVEGLIADAHHMLAKIPTVRDLRAGRPAEKATPKYASKDYQVGLVIFFDDFEGLETYLEHPLHREYVEKHGGSIDLEKLRVYDFVNQKN